MPIEPPPSSWYYKCELCGKGTNFLYNGKPVCWLGCKEKKEIEK